MSAPSTVIKVNSRQRGNDLLKKFTRCSYTFEDNMEADFLMGRTCCAIFLSLRFHAQHPNYIYSRVSLLGDHYDLRVLLVLMDHIEPRAALIELSKLCIRSNLTLMLTWSIEDAAVYLEKYKLNEEKPADSIMERPTNYEYEEALDQYVIDALAESRSVNRTDAALLVSMFDSFEKISEATPEELSLCPGVGLQKAQNLFSLIHKPMKRS